MNPKDAQNYLYYFELDGVLTRPRQVESPEEFLQPGFYSGSAVIQEEVADWIATILDEDYDVRFLTTVFTSEGKDEKLRLLRRLFPDLELEGCLFLPFGESKADYAKWNTVLIDPTAGTLEAWSRAGGPAIQALNPEVHSEKIWDGAILDLSVPFDPEEILTRIAEKPRIAKPEHDRAAEKLRQRQKDFVLPMKSRRKRP